LNLAPSAVAVLIAYVAGITAFGSWLGRRRRSVKDYFLAGRTVPWWAIAACIVATETSTLTFIGAPAMAYTGNWTFLQLVLGYVLGRFLISLLFIPAYFRGDIYTSYEVLQGRFGGPVRATAAALSPSLNSMASTTLRDFYLPYFRPHASEPEQMRVARFFTVFWGLAQIGVALLAQGLNSALQGGLAALSYASGPTVGAFLLGILTRTARSTGTMIGMVVGLATSLGVGSLSPWVFGRPGVAWTWNVAVGAVVTVAVGWTVSRLTPSPAAEPARTQ
jgi:Na+/proline symporter